MLKNLTVRLIRAAAAGALAAACSPSPCTNCLDVKGNYLETVQGNNTGCGDQQLLEIASGQDVAMLDQNGSALSSSSLGTLLNGQLNADGSASFGPVPVTIEPVDGDGNPDPTGMPTAGKLYLNGFFTSGADQAISFSGTYRVIADNDGCELDARVEWSR